MSEHFPGAAGFLTLIQGHVKFVKYSILNEAVLTGSSALYSNDMGTRSAAWRIYEELKAGLLIPRDFFTHRQTPQTYNDSSLLFADRRTLPSTLSPCFAKLRGR